MCVFFITGVSPAAASTGTRARGPPSSRAPRGPASVGGIRVKPFFLGFNVSSIRARLTVRRIARLFVVRRTPRAPRVACAWQIRRAQPQRPLALEREIHRHHAPLAVLAHQFAPRFPRKSCDRAEDDYYPQPAAVAGVYCFEGTTAHAFCSAAAWSPRSLIVWIILSSFSGVSPLTLCVATACLFV